nr:hypothetical protein [Corynebacterium lemuris]
MLLTACGGNGDGTGSQESIEVTTSQTPVAQAVEVEPRIAQTLRGTTTDPGLNVEWTYQGTRSGQYSGSVVTFLVRNLNDEPLPPSSIPAPKLQYNSGGGTMTDATPLSNSDTELNLGLDLPLGAGASTNIQYAFEVSPGNLWDAELQVGNVIFEGNLSY